MRIVFIYMLYPHQMLLLRIRDEENKTLYIFHSLSLSLQCCCVISIEIFLLRNATAFIVNTICTSKLSCCFLIYALNDNWGFSQSCRFLAKHLNPAKNAKKPFLNWPCLSYTNQKTCTTTAKGYTQQVIGWAACNPSCRAILLLLLACELRDTYYLYPSSDNRFIHTHTHTHNQNAEKVAERAWFVNCLDL